MTTIIPNVPAKSVSAFIVGSHTDEAGYVLGSLTSLQEMVTGWPAFDSPAELVDFVSTKTDLDMANGAIFKITVEKVEQTN